MSISASSSPASSSPSSAASSSATESRPTNGSRSLRWRVVDIVVGAVLGVALGLVFFAWNFGGNALGGVLSALLPGLSGLAGGLWLLGGVVGGLVIRKPGAALFVEFVAALTAALLGSQWGLPSLVSGIVQGLGAEIVFACFLYRRWGLTPALLAGAAAAVAEWAWEIVYYYPAQTAAFKGIYLVCLTLSGAVLAGFLGWFLVRRLAATGALSRFESGRQTHARA
ncbi:MAG: ECF transporter S component [Propionibacteriaceae bacterium]|jgi:energy-coupling factor transport system substrate-specific component|nr:ECF transporter S component [Propionibacteriaceae bacterium]